MSQKTKKQIRKEIIQQLNNVPIQPILWNQISHIIINIVNKAFQDNTCIHCGKKQEDHKAPCYIN